MKNQSCFKNSARNSIVIFIIVLSTAIAAIPSTLLADDYDDYQARKARADAEWQAKKAQMELRDSQREIDRLEAGMRRAEVDSLDSQILSNPRIIYRDPEKEMLTADRQQISQNIDEIRMAQRSRLLTRSELNWLTETAERTRVLDRATENRWISGQDRIMLQSKIAALPFLETIDLLIGIENDNREAAKDAAEPFGGIGLVHSTDAHEPAGTITGIFKGGPADKDGRLREGDQIISVAQGVDGDFVDVVEFDLPDLIDLIRGEIGTIVRLLVIPIEQPGEVHLIELVRDEIDSNN